MRVREDRCAVVEAAYEDVVALSDHSRDVTEMIEAYRNTKRFQQNAQTTALVNAKFR